MVLGSEGEGGEVPVLSVGRGVGLELGEGVRDSKREGGR